MTAPLLGVAVYHTTDASQSIESYEVVVLVVEEKTYEVMMRGKFSWGDGGKPSDAKGGYQLGCQQLASHFGLASCSAASSATCCCEMYL